MKIVNGTGRDKSSTGCTSPRKNKKKNYILSSLLCGGFDFFSDREEDHEGQESPIQQHKSNECNGCEPLICAGRLLDKKTDNTLKKKLEISSGPSILSYYDYNNSHQLSGKCIEHNTYIKNTLSTVPSEPSLSDHLTTSSAL